ncbi:hypothetical protein EJB05_37677, partial [Eragrostis curvula]
MSPPSPDVHSNSDEMHLHCLFEEASAALVLAGARISILKERDGGGGGVKWNGGCDCLCFLKQLLILRATAILYKQGKSEFAGSAIVKLEGTKGVEKELSRAEFWLRLRLCVVSLEESCKHNLQTVLLAS